MSTTSIVSKLIKIALALAVLLITGIIIAVNVINPNNYKSDINKLVTDMTSRKFEIIGNIQWSIFPNISLYIQDAKLENPKNFKNDFIVAKEVHVKLKVLPLLQKKFVVKGLELQGIEVNLEKKRNGRTNFDDLINKFNKNVNKNKNSNTNFAVSRPKEEKKNQKGQATDKFSPPQIEIDDLIIKNSKLTWIDNRAKKHYVLTNFNLEAKNFNFRSKRDLPPIKVNGNITDVKKYPEEKLSFNTKIIPNFKEEYVKLRPLNLEFAESKIKSKIKINDFMSEPKFSGNFELLSFSPSVFVNKFKIRKVEKEDKLLPKQIKAKANFFYSKNKLELTSLFLDVDRGKLAGNIDFSLIGKQKLDFDLTADGINAHSLGLFFAVLGNLNFNNGGNKSTSNYFSNLKSLTTKGSLNATNIKINKRAQIDKLSFKAHGNNGIINFSPMDLKLLDSKHDMHIKINVTQKKPSIHITDKADNFAIEKLLYAFNGKQKISGKTSFAAKISMRGTSLAEFKRSMYGQGKIKIRNGYIYGINLRKVLVKAQEGLNNLYGMVKGDGKFILANLIAQNLNKYQVKSKPSDKTPFSSFNASYSIKNGIIHNNDLAINSPSVFVNGNGTISLPKHFINYLAKAKLTEKAIKQETKVDKVMVKYPVEIKIIGNLDNPKITPNVKGYLNAALKDVQKTTIRKFTEKTLKKIIGSEDGADGDDSGKIRIDKLLNIFK